MHKRLNKSELKLRDAIIEELRADIDYLKSLFPDRESQSPGSYVEGQFIGREESILLIKLNFKGE